MIQIPEEIKDLLKQSSVKKNARITFPYDDLEDICNDRLVSESLKFTESFCSQQELKFGLCEASQVTFETFNVGNIKGKTIDVSLEIDIDDVTEDVDGMEYDEQRDKYYYSIKLGRFVVDNCKRDSSNYQKRQVEAYSEIATYDWKVPDSIVGLCKYSWKTSETIKLSGQDIIDLISPKTSYERHKKNGEIVNAQLNGVIVMSMQTKTAGKKAVIRISGKRLSDLRYSTQHRSIITVKSDYNENEYIKALNEAVDMFEGSVSDDAIKKLRTDQIPKTYIDFITSYAHYDANHNGIGMKREDGYKLEIPRNSIYTFLNVWQFYRPTSQTGSDYDATEPLEGKRDNWCFVPEKLEAYYLTDSKEEKLYEKDFDSKLEYCISELSEDDSLIILQSTPFVNTELYRKDSSTGNYTKASKRTDYGFKESLDRYFNDKNIHEYIQAYCELQGGFGKFERDGVFSIQTLDNLNKLKPKVGLKPSIGLRPTSGNADITVYKSMYRRCWYDDEKTKKYSRVFASYKTAENEENIAKYILVDLSAEDEEGNLLYNPEEYQDYDMSNNYYIKNNVYTESEMLKILSTLGKRIRDIQYMPFDIEMVGMPFVEAGDSITIRTAEGDISSYVFRRTLSGIQSLKDSITSD